MAIQTLLYIPVYSSDLAVAKRSYVLFPDHAPAFFNYTVSLIETGALDEAEQLLVATNLRNQPVWVSGYLSGWIAFERGDIQRAIPLLRLAYWQCSRGGYYPLPGVLLAKAMLAAGDVSTARLVLNEMRQASIHNPVELFKAMQLTASLDRQASQID